MVTVDWELLMNSKLVITFTYEDYKINVFYLCSLILYDGVEKRCSIYSLFSSFSR